MRYAGVDELARAVEALAGPAGSTTGRPGGRGSSRAATRPCRCPPWPPSIGALPRYRLNVLNAPHGIPAREGVVHETSFVGVGMRRSPALAYVPSRLSMVPELWDACCRRRWWCSTPPRPERAGCRWASR